ncbi:SpoVR family protein [bacterium]|nr:SpoVR family protein [bacterium]
MRKWIAALVLMPSLVHAGFLNDGHWHDAGHPHSCISAIAGDGIIIPSGRDDDMVEELQKIVGTLWGKEGVLTKLGIRHQEHVLHFLPGYEMSALSANNRTPIGAYIDGRNIIQNLNSGGAPLEFVVPTTCPARSFYRDTLPISQQVSIMLHVAGHYHFGEHSRYSQKRDVDLMAEASALHNRMREWENRESPDEVRQWYQFLHSLAWAQDLRGVRETPEMFDPSLARADENADWRLRSQFLKHPQRNTANILQAFVANLPPTTPAWKKEMASRFERINRYISGAVVTKIINEGFATMMQELAFEYTPYNKLHHQLEVASFMTFVASKSIENPYWLGREIFRVLRKKFNARPEIKDLPRMERDRLFIQYATDEILRKRDSFDAILFALDDNWISEQGLKLVRKATWEEWQDLPFPDTQEPVTQYRIVTNDPDRIRPQIAKSVADFRSSQPRVVLKNLNVPETGEILLGFEDVYGLKLPLKRRSMVQTLYVYSQIMQKPVRLETVRSSLWGISPWGHSFPREERKRAVVSPIEVRVDPAGNVLVWDVEKKEADKELSEKWTQFLTEFKDDLYLGEEPPGTRAARTQLPSAGTAAEITKSIGESVPASLFAHAPTAASAISHYWSFLNSRMAQALQRALSTRGGIQQGGGKIRLKALPTIPTFQFDQRHRMVAFGERANLSPQATTRTGVFDGDDGLGIEEVEGKEGDHYWDRDTEEGQDPGGEEEGEGDPEPGQDPGDQAGEGESDEGYVEIPPELYAKVLGETIELPNLRPKGVHSPEKERMVEGGNQRRDGEAYTARILRQAYRRAMVANRDEETPRRELLRQGIRLLRPSDWHVRDHDEEKRPEINAQVTYVLDGSGSMMGERLRVAKKVAYDLKVLLEQKYPKVVFRYVIFDSAAHVYVDAEEFFSREFGGGTDYATGLRKVVKVQEDFPRAKWDRYVVGLGDLEDFDIPETISALAKVLEQTEFTAFVKTARAGWTSELEKHMRRLEADDPYFGFHDLDNSLNYSPIIFRRLFKKP